MDEKTDSDVTAEADGGDTGLSLVRYAQVSAHVVHFRRAPEAEVLRRLQVRRPDWDRARKHWSELIGDELEEQETGLALAMGEPFLLERERLRRRAGTGLLERSRLAPLERERSRSLRRSSRAGEGLRVP